MKNYMTALFLLLSVAAYSQTSGTINVQVTTQDDGCDCIKATEEKGKIDGKIFFGKRASQPGNITIVCCGQQFAKLKTDDTGSFIVPDLPPGNYTIEAWVPFYRERATEVDIIVKNGKTTNADITMY